jgi:hypothetical protein
MPCPGPDLKTAGSGKVTANKQKKLCKVIILNKSSQ